MSRLFLQILLCFCLLDYVVADVYLHSVRGSNNRLDEANRERNNGNRMFDSQNNDRGGYNVGKLNYYEGEEIPVDWTNQHGCGGEGTLGCELIIQMMCDPIIRDGTTTSTIPTNPNQCRNNNCELDVKYGMHENYKYYQTCERTKRNTLLFTANQNLKKDSARYTRQNPDGTRRGYECPEERDYYPYWRPSPWRDLAIITKDTSRCKQYKEESENVKPRYHCEVNNAMWEEIQKNGRKKPDARYIPITEEECLQLVQDHGDPNDNSTAYAFFNHTDPKARARWVTSNSGDTRNWPTPECLQAEVTRENHLGLIGHKKQYTNTLTIPYILKPGETEAKCVMRIRYNITEDFQGFAEGELSSVVDYRMNSEKSKPNNNNDPARLDLLTPYKLQEDGSEAAQESKNGACTGKRNDKDRKEDCREYYLINNPRVDAFGKRHTYKVGNQDRAYRLKLQLAVNTAQYGRTFQDRTHTFYVKKRPEDVPEDATIKLVTVSGKRGNIVQVFPGTEYFFKPEKLDIQVDNYVHFEWTGSNTNPNNNDGQGKQGTDRSNIVGLKDPNYNVPSYFKDDEEYHQHGMLGNSYPAFVAEPEAYSLPTRADCRGPDHVGVPIAGLSENVLKQLATGRRVAGSGTMDMGNMEELDDAATTFVLPPQKVTQTGCWSFMSTRNNNFSNRSQKGTICVEKGEVTFQDVGAGGRIFASVDGWVKFEPGVLNNIQQVKFESLPIDGDISSHFFLTSDLDLADGKTVEVALYYERHALRTPTLYHRFSKNDDWEDIEGTFSEIDGKTVVTAKVSHGGYFKVDDAIDGGSVFAVIAAVILFVGVCGFMWYYKSKSSNDKVIDHFTTN